MLVSLRLDRAQCWMGEEPSQNMECSQNVALLDAARYPLKTHPWHSSKPPPLATLAITAQCPQDPLEERLSVLVFTSSLSLAQCRACGRCTRRGR